VSCSAHQLAGIHVQFVDRCGSHVQKLAPILGRDQISATNNASARIRLRNFPATPNIVQRGTGTLLILSF
jgi:hypothetical protein